MIWDQEYHYLLTFFRIVEPVVKINICRLKCAILISLVMIQYVICNILDETKSQEPYIFNQNNFTILKAIQ